MPDFRWKLKYQSSYEAPTSSGEGEFTGRYDIEHNALRYADAYAHTEEYAPYIQEKHDKMAEQIASYFADGSAIDVHGLKINGDDLLEIGLKDKQIGDFLNIMLRECLGQPNLNNPDYLKKQAEKYLAKEERKALWQGNNNDLY